TVSAIQTPKPLASSDAAPAASKPSPPVPASGSEWKSMEAFTPPIPPLADTPSSVTIPQAPKPQVAQPSRRGPMMFIGAGALVLILLVVGVGGFFAYKFLKGDANDTSESTNTNPANGTTVEAQRFGRYWLELLPETLIGEPVRVAGVVPLASEQSFKFHFVFSEDGYLYIVGPGEKNQPTAFLTAKPPALSGLDNNKVSKEADFSFPSGLEHWLKLDKKAGAEDYTIIFSPTPLTNPSFLAADATGTPLTREEQMQLTSFVAQYKSNAPQSELNDKNASEPFMELKVPKSGAAGNPVVFEIRIQHK
ncbi:MAG TPA: hypothetical protein VFD48_14380, partial [Pyrinomonadaceae bacterium]|nr:hypothetical protein [Pyrinomonadaceae bacterium]